MVYLSNLSKHGFSQKSDFSTFSRGMSSSKYEFLHVKTHGFGLNWHPSRHSNHPMMIYGLWKKSWKFGFSEKKFSRVKISIVEKFFLLEIMIIILFLQVENDHISSQNFSAPLLGLPLQYPLIFLKVVKKWILTFGLHWTGQQLVSTCWPRKLHCWKVRNLKIIFHILVTFISPKGNQLRHHLQKNFLISQLCLDASHIINLSVKHNVSLQKVAQISEPKIQGG